MKFMLINIIMEKWSTKFNTNLFQLKKISLNQSENKYH